MLQMFSIIIDPSFITFIKRKVEKSFHLKLFKLYNTARINILQQKIVILF